MIFFLLLNAGRCLITSLRKETREERKLKPKEREWDHFERAEGFVYL